MFLQYWWKTSVEKPTRLQWRVSSITPMNWSLSSDRKHTNAHKQVPARSQPIKRCNRQQLVGSWPAGVPLSCAADHPSLCSAGCSWPAALRWSVSAGCSGAGLPAVMNAPSEASPPGTTHAPAAQGKQRWKLGWCRTPYWYMNLVLFIILVVRVS